MWQKSNLKYLQANSYSAWLCHNQNEIISNFRVFSSEWTHRGFQSRELSAGEAVHSFTVKTNWHTCAWLNLAALLLLGSLTLLQCVTILHISQYLRMGKERACDDGLKSDVKLSVWCALIPRCRLQ